jgi:small-conductance mechanosensitive channel
MNQRTIMRSIWPETSHRGGPHRGKRRRAALLSCGLAVLALCLSTLALSQTGSKGGPDPGRIIQFLNQTADWYRQLDVQQRLVSDANDAILMSDNRQIADQAVRLAFEFARAQAESVDAQARSSQGAEAGIGSDAGSAAALPQYQSLVQLEAKQDQETQQTQAEVDGMRQKLRTATGKQRQELQSQLAETQAEVELSKARGDAIRNMVQFVSTSASGVGATGRRAQIEELANSLPANVTSSPAASENNKAGAKEPANPAPTTAPTATGAAATSAVTTSLAGTSETERPGIWEASANVLALWSRLHDIDAAMQQTSALAKSAADIRSPLVNRLRGLTNQGDELAKEADSANPATLAQEKQQLDALTGQFKQISTAAVPISKMGILLNLYQRNLASWRSSVRALLMTNLKGLLVRVALLIVILGLVLGGAELWRRAIYRYVHEPRRRYQFLLLRKFVLWFVIVIIVAFSFASRLGSVLTFAGLLTAGVAVALQNVILSVAGYFFLIGKYGIRSGDRVQIGGVTGEVIDVGLVRIHLMELGGAAANSPTGRVVAFSNSIVFQPTTGLFKQIPGTDFAWHEITLTLPGDTDFGRAKERLVKAVEAGLADYQQEIARQHRAMKSALDSTPEDGLQPAVELRFTSSGLEAVVRFPVDLQHATQIDERVTRELLNDFELTRSGSGNLRLRAESTSSVTPT